MFIKKEFGVHYSELKYKANQLTKEILFSSVKNELNGKMDKKQQQEFEEKFNQLAKEIRAEENKMASKESMNPLKRARQLLEISSTLEKEIDPKDTALDNHLRAVVRGLAENIDAELEAYTIAVRQIINPYKNLKDNGS